MDIRQFIFPFIMAILANSLMIVIIYFLRKIPLFANLFSVGFMVILYLLCILRIILPIELPGIQIILRDQSFYTWFKEIIFVYDDAAHSGSHLSIIPWIILGVWVLGAVILGVRSLSVQRSFKKYLFANGDYSTDEERDLLSAIAQEVLKSDRNISLRKTDAVDRIIVVGLIHKTILIPDDDYSVDELKMIFRHECMHIKGKDLWIKLLIQIYCCVFWWNPVAYLLKKDLDLTLEMKCDFNTTKDFSDGEKLLYIDTLKNRSVSKKRKPPFVVSAELVDGKKKAKLMERIQKLLSIPPNKAKQFAIQTLSAILLFAIFVGSYLFIWQPSFNDEMSEEYYELKEGGEIVDDSVAYLVKKDDGNYTFYADNIPLEEIPKEEVEKGLYDDFPIYE